MIFKNQKNKLSFLRHKIVFGVFCMLFLLNVFTISALANTSVNTTVTVKISICGNVVKEAGEDCDNSDLGGQTCQSNGFSGGNLTCNINCIFNTSGCTSGSGGGGGGSYTPPITPIPSVPQTDRCSNLSKSSDINNNGSVDIFDFNLLMVKWGSVGQNILADINCDGSVDIFDFNLLMVNWGKTF